MNKKLLIENRLQIHLPSNVFLCCYHRYTNGIAWKQPNQCEHPNYKHQAGKKAPPVRTLPLKTLLSFNNHNRSLPIGAVFCYTHLKEEKKKKIKQLNNQSIPHQCQAKVLLMKILYRLKFLFKMNPFPRLLKQLLPYAVL